LQHLHQILYRPQQPAQTSEDPYTKTVSGCEPC
jgi:hypothetical protein